MCYEQQTWPDGRHLSGEFSQQCQMPVAGLSCYFCSLGHNSSLRQDLKPGELDEMMVMCNKSDLKPHCPLCLRKFAWMEWDQIYFLSLSRGKHVFYQFLIVVFVALVPFSNMALLK